MPRRNQTPQHTPFRFASNCQQKRRFDNEKAAEKTADHQMLITPNLELTTYHCELCGGWHLTRQSRK
jgi:hypothetical protein